MNFVAFLTLFLLLSNAWGKSPTSPKYTGLWGHIGGLGGNSGAKVCFIRNGVPYCLSKRNNPHRLRASGKIEPIAGLEDGFVTQVALNFKGDMGCAIRKERDKLHEEGGSLWCWFGNEAYLMPGFESGVTKFALGKERIFCAVKNGGLWCQAFIYHSILAAYEHPLSVYKHHRLLACRYFGDEMQEEIDMDAYNRYYEIIENPTLIPGFETGVTDVAFGYEHGLVVKDDKVWAWGSNRSCRLGIGYCSKYIEPTSPETCRLHMHPPTQVLGLDNVKSVVAGSAYSVAIKHDSTLWAWGNFLTISILFLKNEKEMDKYFKEKFGAEAAAFPIQSTRFPKNVTKVNISFADIIHVWVDGKYYGQDYFYPYLHWEGFATSLDQVTQTIDGPSPDEVVGTKTLCMIQSDRLRCGGSHVYMEEIFWSTPFCRFQPNYRFKYCKYPDPESPRHHSYYTFPESMFERD